MIHIIENTLRDGSYVVDFQFTKRHTQEIVKGLDRLGFNYIEVGHGLGLGAWNKTRYGFAKESDKVYIEAAKRATTKASIVAFFIPGIGAKDDIRQAADWGLDFIRIGINVNNFKDTLSYARLAKDLGLKVAINLMKSYAVKAYEFCKIAQEIDKWDLADVIYLVDSAGCMLPNETAEYIDRTKQKVVTNIGFHGHNNLSLGVANTLQALQSGATYIDTCVKGMGRSAGNAQTEILVYLLSRMGLETGIDLYKLYEFSEKTIAPLMPRHQGLNSDEIHIGVSKFHSSFLPFVNSSANRFGVDKKRLIKRVSDVNCLNPTQELFDEIAERIS